MLFNFFGFYLKTMCILQTRLYSQKINSEKFNESLIAAQVLCPTSFILPTKCSQNIVYDLCVVS